ncbi:MAG: hypothetical protein ABSD98_12320 [Candidatus Korobacteraceae bacterium]
MYLAFVLWDAAGVDAAVGSLAVGLDAAVIGAAVARLRFCLTRRWPVRLVLLRWLLMLSGLRLLMLLSLLRFTLLLALLLVLCVGGGNCSKQEELLTAISRLTLSRNPLLEI